ncbi:MAG: RuvX/YqgF family protein, partial [Desulfobacterota bacterium]|nr:RuvX/YqgF family protein [Thermodesulfobacteriota bacterium]
MRILGLDFGTKTIGVALSDELTITAQTLTSISRTTLKRDLETLQQL